MDQSFPPGIIFFFLAFRDRVSLMQSPRNNLNMINELHCHISIPYEVSKQKSFIFTKVSCWNGMQISLIPPRKMNACNFFLGSIKQKEHFIQQQQSRGLVWYLSVRPVPVQAWLHSVSSKPLCSPWPCHPEHILSPTPRVAPSKVI